MGRNHPLGIVLAAILFGILYQGGAWLSFDMPNITREMIVVIQGLVILFAGALEYMCRPMIVRIYQTLTRPEDETMESFDMLISILGSTIRLSIPLILAALAGLYSERAGVFVIGLEGKMLAAAFAAAFLPISPARPGSGFSPASPFRSSSR